MSFPRPRSVLIAVTLSGCALAWWWQCPPPEPIVEGRRLSLLMQVESVARAPAQKVTPERLRSLGRPAVKWLTFAMEHGRTDLHSPGSWEQLRRWLGRRPPRAMTVRNYNERTFAALYLARIGTENARVIPVLTRMLGSDSFVDAYHAAEALNRMGPATWPSVEHGLASPNEGIRVALAATLWCRLTPFDGQVSEADVTKLFHLLAPLLSNRNLEVRTAAISTLWICANDPASGAKIDTAAAALVASLPDSRSGADNMAIRMLSYYRDHKGESVPRLRKMLDDPDSAMRQLARWALDGLGEKYERPAARQDD